MKKTSVSIPLGDFGRALDVADAFKIASCARKGIKAERVLGAALDFMKTLTAHIESGQTVEAGSHHGMDPFLNVDLGHEIARRKDKTAYLAGKVDVPVSATRTATISHIRTIFKLSSDAQAATLSVRVYQKALEHIWRGNGLSLVDQKGEYQSLNTKPLENLVRGPQQP